MRNSASELCVQCNIMSFGDLLWKLLFEDEFSPIKCMVNSVAHLVSNAWKWWRTTLYTGSVTV